VTKAPGSSRRGNFYEQAQPEKEKIMNNTTLKSFFGFTRHPFPAVAPPEPLFRSERIDDSIAAIKSALFNRMHAILTAPPGFGKSCLVRLLVAELSARDFTVASVVGMQLSVTEWVQKVAERFGIETAARRGAAVKLLRSGIEKLRTKPVLVVDEAQRIPIEALDLFRSVSEDGERPVLSMFLVGDETLRGRLAKQTHAPLWQRMAARVELKRFDEIETAAWIEHSFQTAGMKNILSPSCAAAVYAATGGAPREIGRMLSAAMERALQKRSQILSDEIVQEVLDGRRA
jgi:type II secretory pathway predicted ATPase ExeA